MRALLLLAMLGCGADDGRTVVRLFAASSLTDALREVERAHEAAHPDHDLQLMFAGSQVLQMQLEHGAPADLLAVADAHPLEALGPLLGPGEAFAAGRLVVAVPSDSPLHDARDLPRVERLVVGLPDAPIGRYTAAALRAASSEEGEAWRDAVMERIVSREANVRLVRAKVELGVADAAIVYASDVVGTELRAVALPDAWQPDVRYHIASVGRASPAAKQVLDTLRGPVGQAALAAHELAPLR